MGFYRLPWVTDWLPQVTMSYRTVTERAHRLNPLGGPSRSKEVNLFADGWRETGNFAGATAVEEESGWAVEGFDEASFIRE